MINYYPARYAINIHCYVIQCVALKPCASNSNNTATFHATDSRRYAVNICSGIVIMAVTYVLN